MVGEVKASGLRGRMHAQQEKYPYTCKKVPEDILGIVALDEQSFHLDYQMKKGEQALVEVERKFQGESSAALSTQHCALAKVGEARKCHQNLKDAEIRLKVAQVTTNRARNDAKVAREEASKFDANFVAKMGRRQDEVGALTKQLRQQVASAAAG